MLTSIKRIEIPCPNEVLTTIRVIEEGQDITSMVTLRHLFEPRRVIIESELPITGFIEII